MTTAINGQTQNVVSNVAYHPFGETLGSLELGRWYEEGDGVTQSESEAVRWYRLAAEHGNFFASSRLSRAYETGELGLGKDEEMVRKYEQMYKAQISRTP